ncbi:MAG: MarR family transcriptional regulator [Balneolaceae bacterium]
MGTFHHSINTFSRIISAFFDERFKESSLATSYVELLLLIQKNEKLSQKEISAAMDLAPSTITRFLAKLEKKGLVEKTREAREVVVKLTGEGKTLSLKLQKKYTRAEKELNGILGEKYIETTGKLLDHGAELMKG